MQRQNDLACATIGQTDVNHCRKPDGSLHSDDAIALQPAQLSHDYGYTERRNTARRRANNCRDDTTGTGGEHGQSANAEKCQRSRHSTHREQLQPIVNYSVMRAQVVTTAQVVAAAQADQAEQQLQQEHRAAERGRDEEDGGQLGVRGQVDRGSADRETSGDFETCGIEPDKSFRRASCSTPGWLVSRAAVAELK